MAGYIYIVLKEAVLVTIIMVIIKGALRDKHIMTRALVCFLVSLAFFLVSCVSFVFDWVINKTPILDNLNTLAFGATSIVYMIIEIVQLSKKNKFAGRVKKKMVYTYHEKDEYIYVLYKFQDNIFLTKNTNKGIIIKLKKQEFADDAITSLNEKMKVKVIGNVERLGIVTCKGEKRDDVYYCYLINVENYSINDKLDQVSIYRIGDVDCEKFDKFIILKLLMGNEFDEIM